MAIHCNGRLVCHQEMERQRGERAQGYDEELGLVLDQRLDRAEQVKLVCGSKIGAGLYVQYDPFSQELPEAMRQRDH